MPGNVVALIAAAAVLALAAHTAHAGGMINCGFGGQCQHPSSADGCYTQQSGNFPSCIVCDAGHYCPGWGNNYQRFAWYVRWHGQCVVSMTDLSQTAHSVIFCLVCLCVRTRSQRCWHVQSRNRPLDVCRLQDVRRWRVLRYARNGDADRMPRRHVQSVIRPTECGRLHFVFGRLLLRSKDGADGVPGRHVVCAGRLACKFVKSAIVQNVFYFPDRAIICHSSACCTLRPPYFHPGRPRWDSRCSAAAPAARRVATPPRRRLPARVSAARSVRAARTARSPRRPRPPCARPAPTRRWTE
jgi:hypothetical protein